MSSTSGTKAANSRIYHLPLQYRTGNDGEFTDLVDGQGNPAEYRPQDENHTRTFGPLPLPQELMGQERVELFWRYYYTGERMSEESGQRSEITLSNIFVERVDRKS